MSPKTTLGWPYDILDLTEKPSDKRAVKKAYARKLKTLDQATQADDFQALRQAYEYALTIVDHGAQSEPSDFGPGQILFLHDELPPETWNIDLARQEPDRPSDDFDWDALQDLCEEIPKTSKSDNTQRLRIILEDPLLDDLQAAAMIESAFFSYVADGLDRWESGHVEFRSHITDELLDLLEDRFSWSSDFVAFQKKFYLPDDLWLAFSNRMGAAAFVKKPLTTNQKIWLKYGNYLVNPITWILWALMVLSVGLLQARLNLPSGFFTGIFSVPLLIVAAFALWTLIDAAILFAKNLMHFLNTIYQKIADPIRHLVNRRR